MNQMPDIFEYDNRSGVYSINLPKAFKGIYSQAGLKIIIDPGLPTGESGAIYSNTKPSGLRGSKIIIQGFDNLSSWVSYAEMDLQEFLKALLKLVPSNKKKTKTFVLPQQDLETIKKRKQK